MNTYPIILQNVNRFYELGQTIQAANYLVDEYELNHPNFNCFELREKAEAKFILLTTEGVFGQTQIIRIPENVFDFDLVLILNMIAHEMVHVSQKVTGKSILDRNEREWQAYYEMLFHEIYPKIPKASNYHQLFFAKKALEYYSKMDENSRLQIQYKDQKKAVEELILLLNKSV